jgi:hypothetical protein
MNRKQNPLATLLAATTVALACLGAATLVHATSPDLSRLDPDRLERLFWDCDARATQEVLSPGDGAMCSSVSDMLKLRLFNGDFERMLGWWRTHKAAEYALRGVGAAPAETTVEVDEAALQAP